MSEPESFLSRWTRLKREATEPPDAATPDAPHGDEREAVRATQADPAAASASAPLPTFDLSALPAIESITATTDIRAFLAPGVPAELTRAALRRAWVADPQIRDFVGIAENQWDFNDPNGIPGFGPLDPLDVRRLLAQAIGAPGDSEDAPAIVAENSPAVVQGGDSAAIAQPEIDATAGQSVANESEVKIPAVSPAPDVQRSEPNTATQQEEGNEETCPSPAVPARRGHGGALPK